MAILSTVETLKNFTGFSESFLYGKSEQQADNRDYMPSWFEIKSTLRTFVDMANESVSVGEDQYNSQECLNAAKYIMDNQQFYF